MKVSIYSRTPEKILPLITSLGFSVDDINPDFIITFGGDGTIVHAEFAHPSIPKIILKESAVCKKCTEGSVSLSNEEILNRVKEGKYLIKDLNKVEAKVNDKTLTALNDITLHNGDPRHAIRYDVLLDGQIYIENVIGDGVVVSTPFGSTGYYRSITDSYFETGIGLAFNNSTEQSDHVVLNEDRVITIKINRGPSALYADNQAENIALNDNDIITISKSKEIAHVVRVIQ